MADETRTTGPADASNRAGLPAEALAKAGSNPEPEARIIEETIIKPPPRAAAEFPAPPASAPPPTTNIVQEAKPTPPTPVPPVAPLAAAQTPPSSTPPMVPPVTIGVSKERERISTILQEVKLPERRTPTEKVTEEPKKGFDTALGATEAPKQAPPAPPLASPPPSPPPSPSPSDGSDPSTVSPLRTLKNDLQEIIRTKKMSLVHAVALEQEKRRGAAETRLGDTRPGSRRAFGTLFAAGLLIVLGGAALFGVYFIMSERAEAPSGTLGSSILFAENAVSFPLENQSPIELKRLLAQARTSGGATLGSITEVVPTMPLPLEQDGASASASGVRAATFEEFASALGARPPADLLRALMSVYFFGIHTVDENAPLLVIPVLSYERAFAGMLAWEKTMNAELAPVFTAVPTQVIGPSGLPEGRRFEDVVMRNYDVRVLKDDAGNIQLFYSFPTRSLLVIGESPYSFTEILSRLRAERKL